MGVCPIYEVPRYGHFLSKSNKFQLLPLLLELFGVLFASLRLNSIYIF